MVAEAWDTDMGSTGTADTWMRGAGGLGILNC